MGRTRASWDFEADDEGHEALERAGKALLAPKEGKDQLLRTLKGAGDHLAEANQSSESAKLASRDLAKALGRPELLGHKDKEVRLYAALCLTHILRLNAPDTPYTDDQLQSIFELLNSVYAELEDPASPHFQLCLSILEAVSQIKCSLLILDLPKWEELVVDLFTTLMDVVNTENAEVLGGTVLELLRSLIEEADDLPQAQLDVLLSRLLPAHRDEAPAGHALAASLLQRTETTVQPYLQKFLTALLLGGRTDSELKGDYHSLFYALHETLPQTLLPLMPLLREELDAEMEDSRRGAAVDLVARLFTQHPSGAGIIEEYPALLDALLGRACDKEAEVRRKVLQYALPLVQACSNNPARVAAVVRVAVGRLYDVDDSVRRAAVPAVCSLLQEHPELAASQNTEGRGTVLSCLSSRLRDKKPAVRREAASHMVTLMRAWVLLACENEAHAPPLGTILGIPLVVCNLAVRDSDLGAFVFDTVFRAGVFPAKLPPADVARWWAALWTRAGEDSRPVLAKVLQGKAGFQRQVQTLLALRSAAKEHRTSSLTGAASSMGAGAVASASGSMFTAGGGGGGGQAKDPEARLQALVHELATVLKDVNRPEEGLQKLLEAKDNHIFRGLAILAAYGCTYKDAGAAGKDVMQRVGSKGPIADLTRALVARLTPSLLAPEVLHAAMEAAGQREEAQHLLVDVATSAPQLLAQSLDQVMQMFEADDPLLSGCAAKVLARAARPMLAHAATTKRQLPDELVDKLTDMCSEGSPADVKAAVKALVAVLGPERAVPAASRLADQLVEQLKAPATLRSHVRLLAALKGLSMLGRLLPDVFERVADDVLDFVIGDLMDADLSRGKPLVAVDPAKTGRKWRHPSPVTAIKTAALRTLCQALVPENPRAKISQAMTERAQLVWALLEPLLDTDAAADQFQPFDLEFPRSGDAEQLEQRRGQRAKRRRVEGGSSGSEGEEEEAATGEEEEEMDCTDAAWVRYSAVCGLLRLVRAHDTAMPASLYANLALTFQEPLVDTRRAMTVKLARAVAWLTSRSSAQRAAKYAAMLALMAIDPEDRNRTSALRALRDYVLSRRVGEGGSVTPVQHRPNALLCVLRDHVLSRRASVARLSAATAAAGGGGGALLQEMPEFMLPFLIFLLAHHPDYPTQETLDEFDQMDPEEQEEVYGGGTPFTPFLGMLQFALEVLVVPSDQATNPAEVARMLPATLKLLRTLKFCDDASGEPRTEESHQLCDLAMVLARQVAMRLTKGKPQDPGRFPGQVMLPRMCFAANLTQYSKKVDGSDLPDARYFTPGLYQDDIFLRRLLMPGLPGPAAVKGGSRGRAKPPQKQQAAKRRKVAAAAEAEEEEGTAEASDDESVGGTPVPGAEGSEGGHEQHGGSGSGKLGRTRVQRGAAGPAADSSGAESMGGTAASDEAEEEQALAPRTKKTGTRGGAKRAPTARPKAAAGTPSRQQPRRGAKADAAANVRDESSAEEEDEEAAGSSQESEEPLPRRQAQQQAQQQQRRGGGAAGPPAAALRADTDDEEEEEEEQEEQQQQAVPKAKAQAQQQQQQRRQPKKGKQQQQQPQDVSPGQENQAGGNAAGRGGGGKTAGARGKATTAAAAAGKSKPVKSALKRGRA